MTNRPQVLVVFGTRPEAVKLAPLVIELDGADDIDAVVAVTGQHREMLDPVLDLFKIVPRHDLDICAPRQTLTDITTAALRGLTPLIRDEQPDAVIVQGDTTTAFCGALAAFYERVPVVHLEAGLTTGRLNDPFPEEANRRMISQVADLHLAHGARARRTLEARGIDPSRIIVTGNTVIDALLWAIARPVPYSVPHLASFVAERPHLVLVTAHRRESWGQPMKRIAHAVATLSRRYPEVGFVLPMHLNPAVREILVPTLAGLSNVLLTDPLPYGQFCRVMKDSDIILTDSGGVQEEAPTLRRPVLVLRESTERPEGVAVGFAEMVGTDEATIVRATSRLLDHPEQRDPPACDNPYGDGHAAERAAAGIRCLLGVGDRLPDFSWREPWP